MMLMTPALTFLYGGMARASAQSAISAALRGGRAGNSAWAYRGRWDPVFELPNVAIHTSVLPNGKVLFWGRRDQPTGSMHDHECTPYVWDPRTGELTPTPQPQRVDGTKVNLFCSGHAYLPDGRLLVAGGHITDGDGLDQACVYDYRSNTWTALPVMNERRWYPTATALSDGTVLVSSGSYKDNGRVIINDVPQIWDGHQWTPTADFVGLPLYPRMHVAPSGQVFISGSNASNTKAHIDDHGSRTALPWIALPWPKGARQNGERQYGPSVMYDAGKVIYSAAATTGPPTSLPPRQRSSISVRIPRRGLRSQVCTSRVASTTRRFSRTAVSS
jgi:galactose oxidase